jgi:hypothetical protein
VENKRMKKDFPENINQFKSEVTIIAFGKAEFEEIISLRRNITYSSYRNE